jgi:hypothetical protein
VGWEIVNHPLYSPDLAPSDLHLFGPMRVHIGVQKFRTDYELKTQCQELAIQSG